MLEQLSSSPGVTVHFPVNLGLVKQQDSVPKLSLAARLSATGAVMAHSNTANMIKRVLFTEYLR